MADDKKPAQQPAGPSRAPKKASAGETWIKAVALQSGGFRRIGRFFPANVTYHLVSKTEAKTAADCKKRLSVEVVDGLPPLGWQPDGQYLADPSAKPE